MGRDLQKRKNRSSRAKVTQSNKPKKTLNPRGNTLIAKNWNKKETLSQNYRRLGLVSKLGRSTGGVEARPNTSDASDDDNDDEDDPFVGFDDTPKVRAPKDDPLAINSRQIGVGVARNAIAQVRVERDAEGKIVKVLRRENPLGDVLNDLEDDEEEEEAEAVGAAAKESSTTTRRTSKAQPTRVVDLLAVQADVPIVPHTRHQSQREKEWIERLVAKHGEENVGAMARDARLNPMQQTASDLKKRIRSWKEGLGKG